MVDDCQEIWKPVVGYEELYEISGTGTVRRIVGGYRTYAGRILKPSVNGKGYLTVHLLKGKSRPFLVHRLVATAHIHPIPLNMVVNHKDGKKQNNHFGNLEIVTHTENEIHAYRFGLKHRVSPITEMDVRMICALQGHMTSAQVGSAFGITFQGVCRIWRGERWSGKGDILLCNAFLLGVLVVVFPGMDASAQDEWTTLGPISGKNRNKSW